MRIDRRRTIKVFVAGATGAVGKRLVPLLVASGYEVTGSTRSAQKEKWLREVGAKPAVVDALDRDAVMQAEPEDLSVDIPAGVDDRAWRDLTPSLATLPQPESHRGEAGRTLGSLHTPSCIAWSPLGGCSAPCLEVVVTKDSDFKKLVRQRMAATGQSLLRPGQRYTGRRQMWICR
jgi:NAD(P)-dependent dehydrogenase (short-subunit alcohol dehydrogenase family)